VIVILKRYDLPEEHRQMAVEDLELDHFQLSREVMERAELIVLVEGPISGISSMSRKSS
jgi:hypothetical protein